MRRRAKNIIVSLFVALFATCILSGPIFATSVTTDQNSTQQTTSETDQTTNQDAEQNNNQTTDQDAEQNTNQSENQDITPESEEQPTCYSEVGGIGWLICPGTGFLANVIDGAYNIIEDLIKVDPLPSDENSPIYVVWTFIKNTANLVFVILLLIVIYSQITGIGINNYGIKRVLPRLIVAAIAMNLSFLICTLAVDISNILGGSIIGLFNNILNEALAGSQISDVAASTSVASVVATILGIGTVGTVVTLTLTGGIGGLLWALIPIVLSGALAVISAVITMAARQALIILLAMISPLAIACCLLPNTERWYRQWKDLFISMIIFYPMFSILYGASRLAGLVVITSADNWLGVILGIAIEVLPLFFSIPLMRMSGTMLGRIDGFVRRAGAPMVGATHRLSTEHQSLAKQKQLEGTSRFAALPHNHLARYLEQRRVNRAVDLNEAAASNVDRYHTRATGRNYFNSRGQLNKRGIDHYERESRRIQNNAERTHYSAVFDQGFATNGTDSRVGRSSIGRIARINDEQERAIVNDSIASAYANSVKFENMENRAQLIQDGMKNQNSRIYSQVIDTFNVTNAAERQRAVSAVLSDAITAKARVDKEAKDNYSTYFNSIEPGNELTQILSNSIDSKDYNAMVSAIQTMADRGDHDKIGEVLRTKSSSIYGNDAVNRIMQKELRDTLIRMKSSDANVWAWAKANMIRSAMNASGAGIASYIDYETFMQGGIVQGDTAASAIAKVNSDTIIQGITDSGIAKGQDRTVFNDILDMQQRDIITQQNGRLSLKYSIKQLRTAATSGAMDGDQLDALNHLITGGVNKNNVNQTWVNNNRGAIIQNIEEFLSGMSASQLASTKTATIVSLNDALMKLDTSDIRELNGHRISGHLADALLEQSAALCRSNAVTDRNKMNHAVRDMLGISELDQSGTSPRRPGGTQDAIRIATP